MNILITGGLGFAGASLAKRLWLKGETVTILDFVSGFQSDELKILRDKKNVCFIWKALQDVTERDIVGQDVVIHLAAQADVPLGFSSPKWTVEQNVMGTVALLEAVKNCPIKKFILAGSGSEFGRAIYLPIDEKHPLTPQTPYGFSKAAQEMAGWSWHRCYGIPMTVMSNSVVVGPGMRREIFVYKWIYNIINNQPIILEGGKQTRDITYITDVMDAWELAIYAFEKTINGEKFNISYGEEHSVEEIMEICFEVCGKQVDVIRNPYRPGEEGRREFYSNDKVKRVLGYKPKVGLKESLMFLKYWIEATLQQ